MLAGGLLWSLACSSILLLSLWQAERLETFHRYELLMVVFTGSLLGWFATELADLAIGRRLSFRWRWPLMTVFLAGATLAFTAFLFALDYRAFYARWHASAFSIDWTLQFLFTSASATYQFLGDRAQALPALGAARRYRRLLSSCAPATLRFLPPIARGGANYLFSRKYSP